MPYTSEEISRLRILANIEGGEEEGIFESIIQEGDESFLKAAKSKDGNLQITKATSYFNEGNLLKAFLLLKIASQTSIIAQNQLAHMYNNGIGIKENKLKAIALFRSAADGGDLGAQVEVGNLYETGVEGIIPKNITAAYRYFHSAASQKYPIGQYRLAILIHEFPLDALPEARRDQIFSLLESAAKMGYRPAIVKLETLRQQEQSHSSSQNPAAQMQQIIQKLETLKKDKTQATKPDTQQGSTAQTKKLEPLTAKKQAPKKQRKEGQEGERTNERTLLSNTISKMERELEKIEQDVEQSINDKPASQKKILIHIQASMKTLTEKIKFDKSGQRKRTNYLNNIRNNINELDKLYEDIETDRKSVLAATEHLLLLSQLCNGLITPLSDSQRTLLEGKLKALEITEPKSMALETFLEARAVLSATTTTDEKKDAALKKVRLSLEEEFVSVQQKYNTLLDRIKRVKDKDKILQTLANATLELREGELEPNPKDKGTIEEINEKIEPWKIAVGKIVSSDVKPTEQRVLSKQKTRNMPKAPSVSIHYQPEILMSPPPSPVSRTTAPMSSTAKPDEVESVELRAEDTLHPLKITEQKSPTKKANRRSSTIKRPAFQAPVGSSSMLKMKLEQLDAIIEKLSDNLWTQERKYALLCSLAQVSEIIAKENNDPDIQRVAARMRDVIFKDHETVLDKVANVELLNMARGWVEFLQKNHIKLMGDGGFRSPQRVIKALTKGSDALQKIYDLWKPLEVKAIKDDSPVQAPTDRPLDVEKSKEMIEEMQSRLSRDKGPLKPEDEMIHKAAQNFYLAILGFELKNLEETGNLSFVQKFESLRHHVKEIIRLGVFIRHPKAELTAAEDELQLLFSLISNSSLSASSSSGSSTETKDLSDSSHTQSPMLSGGLRLPSDAREWPGTLEGLRASMNDNEPSAQSTSSSSFSGASTHESVTLNASAEKPLESSTNNAVLPAAQQASSSNTASQPSMSHPINETIITELRNILSILESSNIYGHMENPTRGLPSSNDGSTINEGPIILPTLTNPVGGPRLEEQYIEAFMPGKDKFNKFLTEHQLMATKVDGSQLDCYINSLLQHATGHYHKKKFDDSLIRQIKQDAGIDPNSSQMRDPSTSEALDIIKAINKRYHVNLEVYDVQINRDGQPGILGPIFDRENLVQKRPVFLWLQATHFVAITSTTLYSSTLQLSATESKDGNERKRPASDNVPSEPGHLRVQASTTRSIAPPKTSSSSSSSSSAASLSYIASSPLVFEPPPLLSSDDKDSKPDLETAVRRSTPTSLPEQLSSAIQLLNATQGPQPPDSKLLRFRSNYPDGSHVDNSPTMKTLEDAIKNNDIDTIRNLNLIRRLDIKEIKDLEGAISKINNESSRKSMQSLIELIIANKDTNEKEWPPSPS